MKSRKASFLISSRFSQCQSRINLFLQAVMGFQNLLPLECVVIREGREQTLCSEKLVVGDLIKIKTGMRIPADCRILAANQLKLESSSITGEAEPHGLAPKLASFISK